MYMSKVFRYFLITCVAIASFGLCARDFDGTGPAGTGPRTGRGRGNCGKVGMRRVLNGCPRCHYATR